MAFSLVSTDEIHLQSLSRSHQLLSRRIMKKAFILAAALCSAAACSNNQAVTTNENGKEIITDGFRVVSADESFPAEDLLGPLGDKKVVRGRKDPSHLAFVKNDNGHNYIIVNKILVTCPKNVNCIPADLQAKQLSRSVYGNQTDCSCF